MTCDPNHPVPLFSLSFALLSSFFVAFTDTIFEHLSCASCHAHLFGTTYRAEQAHALNFDLLPPCVPVKIRILVLCAWVIVRKSSTYKTGLQAHGRVQLVNPLRLSHLSEVPWNRVSSATDHM
ncbi:hypothetical protein C8Q70DRAFT_687441 [Cubamyces menziesii]|nr:hypothetical protein C8Q70DRAFT_687441 [Cubamyces menziesii]